MRLPETLASAAIARWERSQAFQLGPVSQPVRLELSEKHFPTAWSPSGSAVRTEVLRAVEALEAAGLATVRRTGRGAFSTPKAVILPPSLVEEAYAQTPGETLRSHLSALRNEILQLPSPPTDWTAAWLSGLVEELETGRTGQLGRAGKDPSTRPDLLDTVRLVLRIAEDRPYDERTLGGEMFGDTKRLRDLRPRVRQILLSADPYWEGRVEAISDRDLFRHYHEIFKPPFTSIALGMHVPGLADFGQFRPYAQLSNPLLARVGEQISGQASLRWITTIENESAFVRYLEEPGVQSAVERDEEVVLYTEGYATEAVCAFVATVCRAGASLRHWGDVDSYGLQIALLLAEAAGEATLFRCDAEWVRSAPSALGKPLTAEHRERLAALALDSRLDRLLGARDLIKADLERGMWWEQEVFYVGADAEA